MVDDVILGCAMPEAEQGMNVARIASLLAGIPHTASAMTVNRFCSSGLQAIALAHDAVTAGRAQVAVAGGTESMSLIPMGGHKISPNPTLLERYPDSYLGMGMTAELVARKYGIDREKADAFALRSHQRAVAAIDGGRFKDEIVPVPVNGHAVRHRRRPAPRHRRRGAGQAAPAFAAEGSVTAGNSQPDVRRRRGHDRDVGGAREGARPHAPGPPRHLRGGRRAAGDHGHRPHRGHPARR